MDEKPIDNSAEVAEIVRQNATRTGDRWFGVRTIYRWPNHGSYEERITMWRTDDLEKAVALAEEEAAEYQGLSSNGSIQYLGLAQGFDSWGDFDGGVQGFEIFSLLRKSRLWPEKYIARFFSTGSEHQSVLPA